MTGGKSLENPLRQHEVQSIQTGTKREVVPPKRRGRKDVTGTKKGRLTKERVSGATRVG